MIYIYIYHIIEHSTVLQYPSTVLQYPYEQHGTFCQWCLIGLFEHTIGYMKLDPSGVYIYICICIYAISFQIWYFRMGGPMLYVYIYIYDGNIAGVSLISNWSTPLKVSSNTFFGCSILLFLLRVVWTFNTCNPVSDCVSHTIYIGSDWGHHATYIYIYI